MKELKRNYNMPDADLMFKVGDFVENMTRDATEFATRGVDAAATTAFETLGNAFEIFPTDEYYAAQVSAEVEAKNAAREQCMIYAQKISGFFEQQWGLNSWQYKQLKMINIARASDNNFKVICRNIVLVATDNLTTLSAIGMTQTDIDNLEDETQLMEDKGHAIHTKETLRDSKTAERIEKGNELYSYLRKYGAIGKLIWENVDEAKYNDYIIYKTEHKGLSKPQNVAVEYVAGSPPVNHISWDAVTDAASYDVYVSIRDIGAPSGDYNLLNNYTDVFADVQPVDNRRNYYKLKAKNAEDTSDYSDEVFVDVTPA